MDISYLGHSSFRIKGKSLAVVMDPFSLEVGFKFPKVEGDLVTISHEHFDHNNAVGVDGVKRIFREPGEYEVSGISIIGIPSFHDTSQGGERGKNTIFVVEMDNFRLAHLGDLGHKLTDSQVEAMGEINILMIPVGGTFTIGSKEAVDVVNAIEPNIVLPMHYKVERLREDLYTKLEPAQNFVSAFGGKVVSLPKLSVKLEEISQEEQVVYLLERK